MVFTNRKMVEITVDPAPWEVMHPVKQSAVESALLAQGPIVTLLLVNVKNALKAHSAIFVVRTIVMHVLLVIMQTKWVVQSASPAQDNGSYLSVDNFAALHVILT